MATDPDAVFEDGWSSKNMAKILVFGNSGSGKTTFAKNLLSDGGTTHLELDTLAWLPVSPPRRRPIEESQATIKAFTETNESWVIEGCYTDLLELLIDEADEILFLNLPEDECIANALIRPFEAHKFSSAEAQERNQALLLQWIQDYKAREDDCSYNAHRELFDKFNGKKTEATSKHY
jgi:adenylate kinase family enzyme